jgi:hypothetical protein
MLMPSFIMESVPVLSIMLSVIILKSHFAECHSAIFSTKFVKEKVGVKNFAEKFVFANFLTKKKERPLVHYYSAHSDHSYNTFMSMK